MYSWTEYKNVHYRWHLKIVSNTPTCPTAISWTHNPSVNSCQLHMSRKLQLFLQHWLMCWTCGSPNTLKNTFPRSGVQRALKYNFTEILWQSMHLQSFTAGQVDLHGDAFCWEKVVFDYHYLYIAIKQLLKTLSSFIRGIYRHQLCKMGPFRVLYHYINYWILFKDKLNYFVYCYAQQSIKNNCILEADVFCIYNLNLQSSW